MFQPSTDIIFTGKKQGRRKKEGKNKMLRDHKRKLMYATGSRLEHSHQQSISYLAQETKFQDVSYFRRNTSKHEHKPLRHIPEMYEKHTALPKSEQFSLAICDQSGFLYPNNAGGVSHFSI
jgi:hypothetical protein